MRVFQVDVPLCSLRPYAARDYQETLPVPPPSSVLGMLLSLLGLDHEDVTQYANDRMGIALRPGSSVSRVLRRMRRDSATDQKRGAIGRRPETQELLVDLRFWVCIDGRLAIDVARALAQPWTVERYGAVSLGESAFVVDVVREVDGPPEDAVVLRPDASGLLSLTTRVDFSDRTRTRYQRYSLVPSTVTTEDLVPVVPGRLGS